MSDQDDDQQSPDPSKVTAYRAGKVPGVEYRHGAPQSSPEGEQGSTPPPAAPAAQPGRRSSSGKGAAGSTPTKVAPPPGTGKPPSRKRFTAGRVPRWLGGILVVILAAVLVLGWLVWSRIDKVDAVPDDHGSAVSEGKVYLVVGSDSREELTPEERNELGTGYVSGRRTDVVMLLHLPTDGRPALVSIPRDSLVDVPGEGTNRINSAYSFGGPSLLVETVEQNTGVAIDDYVEIGFGGFASVVEALDGVDICLDEAIQDDKAHIDLPAGCQTLDGQQALGYSRARYFDPDGDLGRVERQRKMIGVIADETLSPGTLLNPLALSRVALTGGDALILDEGTGPVDLGRFAWTMRSLSSGDGDTLTVPLGRVGNTINWDEDAAEQLWSALRSGDEVPRALLDE